MDAPLTGRDRDFLWKPPFMIDAGWVVGNPQQAIEVVFPLAREIGDQVLLAASLQTAIESRDYPAILELQQQLARPLRPQLTPSPQDVVRILGSAIEGVRGFRPQEREKQNELATWADILRRPPRFLDQVLAEEFLFMKSSSTLLAKARRVFNLLRDRGKPLLEVTQASLERKRTFMGRHPNVRFFVGMVVVISGAMAGPLAPLVSSAGGAVIAFGDP